VALTFGIQFGCRPVKLLKVALTFVLLKLLIWGQPVKRLKVALTFGIQFGCRPVKLLMVALTRGCVFMCEANQRSATRLSRLHRPTHRQPGLGPGPLG
jgi:hypothetical protein